MFMMFPVDALWWFRYKRTYVLLSIRRL